MVVRGDYFLLVYCLNTCPGNHKISSVAKYIRNPCMNKKSAILAAFCHKEAEKCTVTV